MMQRREQFVLLFYTLFNIIANKFIWVYSDETYYWMWSKRLDFSYFDHPPMVAYMVKLTTIFGDDPLFLRLSAALLVSGSAYLIYMLAKKMFDEKTAIYSFYIFLSGIIILAASTIMSPDIPLMFFTTLLLYSGYVYIFEEKKKYALLVGFAAGAMLLSKYTGILIIFTLVMYLLMYKRELFKDKYLYYAVVVAIVVFSPVLYWNYQHDFISFTFQLNHGVAQEKVFQAEELWRFISAQLVLFHPFYLLPLLYFIIRDTERFESKKVYLLLPFLFTIFFFIYHSAFKYANAQWAAPAYLSATILLGYYMAKGNYKKLLTAALILSAILFIAIKTPLGDQNIKVVERLFSRLGQIDRFKEDIENLHLDIEKYDYILIDDYHGSEIAYFFKKYKNILVLNNARFSNYNIWRNQDLNISLESPLKTIPSLGKCLYIGNQPQHIQELEGIFHNKKEIATLKRQVSFRKLHYYFVEFKN